MVKEIRTRLLEDSVISTEVGTRIYPMERPQGVKETAIIYDTFGNDPIYCKEGSEGDFTDLQLVVYSKKYSTVDLISKRIRHLLEYYSGPIEGGQILNITFENMDDDYSKQSKEYAKIIDMRVMLKKDPIGDFDITVTGGDGQVTVEFPE